MQSTCLSRCGNTSYITETGSITTSHITKPSPHLVYIQQHFQMQRVKISKTGEKFGKTDDNTKSFIFVWSKAKHFILFFSPINFIYLVFVLFSWIFSINKIQIYTYIIVKKKIPFNHFYFHQPISWIWFVWLISSVWSITYMVNLIQEHT